MQPWKYLQFALTHPFDVSFVASPFPHLAEENDLLVDEYIDLNAPSSSTVAQGLLKYNYIKFIYFKFNITIVILKL